MSRCQKVIKKLCYSQIDMELNLKTVTTILAKTPKLISLPLEDMPREWLFANEGKNTWSSYDIVGHLIHGEKTDWIPRVKIILGKGSKEFEPFDRFAQQHLEQLPIKELLEEFSCLRENNLSILQSLNIQKEQLQLKGIHPEFGEVTLKQLLATWVAHDLNHIAQINRVLAKNYKQEVGPWISYIKILNL